MSQCEHADESASGIFRAFQMSWFRSLWVGRSLATAGFRTQAVARDWLVYSLSGSSFAISIAASSWSLGTFLFSLVGGATADRVEKRRLLVLGQAACGVVVLLTAGLASTDVVRVWHLAVATLLLAMLFSFVIPARKAAMSALSPDSLLMNVVALSTAGIGLMSILSSSLSGMLIEKFSPAVAFGATTVLFGVAAWSYSRIPSVGVGADGGTPIRRIVTEGGQYVLDRPALVMLFGLELVRALFFQYTMLLPAVAGDVFEMGGLALGILKGARGLGSFVASMMMAWRGGARRRHALMLVSGGLGGLGLILFGQLRSFAAAFAALTAVGTCEYVYLITRSTLLQSVESERMRGRMVGFRRLVWGLRPLGALPAGAVADAIGPLPTVTLEGVLVAGFFGAVALWRVRMQRKRNVGTE